MTDTNPTIDDLVDKVGEPLGESGWLDITQERINTFADATDDHQWIHVDPERAAEGPFGGPIAHGYLTLSLIVPLLTDMLQVEGVSMALNYGLNKVRFPTPVPVGSKVRLKASLAGVEEVAGGVQVLIDCLVEIDGGTKPACAAQAVYRLYR
jgi:acyl dehydratase